MQAGLHGALRYSDNILDFRYRVTLGIVQQHDNSMFVTELPQRTVQVQQLFMPPAVSDRIFGPGEVLKAQKVVAGTDPVALDAYCCTLWGLEAEDIFVINKAYDHGLGEKDLKKKTIKEVEV